MKEKVKVMINMKCLVESFDVNLNPKKDSLQPVVAKAFFKWVTETKARAYFNNVSMWWNWKLTLDKQLGNVPCHVFF